MKTKTPVSTKKQSAALKDLKTRKNPKGGNTYTGITTVNAGNLATTKPTKPKPIQIESWSF
jgi:hypothetical protein